MKFILRKSHPRTTVAANRFTVRFIFFCALFFLLLNLTPDSWFNFLNVRIAAVCGAILNLLGEEVSINGVVIRADGFSVMVIGECSGVFLLPPLLSFIAAWPAIVKKRMAGWIVGTTFIFSLNICRIVLLFLTGTRFPGLFDFVHAYLFQILMMGCVIFAIIAWLHRIDDEGTPGKPLIILGGFILISLPLFILWMFIGKWYTVGISMLAHRFVSIDAVPVSLYQNNALFLFSLNIITLIALFISYSQSKIRARLPGLLAALAFLILFHFAFSIGILLVKHHHIAGMVKVTDAVYFSGQYLIPLLVLGYVVRKEGWKRGSEI